MQKPDEEFFKRADAHIHLANEQISHKAGRSKVSASFMYAMARFSAWISACSFSNADDMKQEKQETIDYFVNEYRIMLEENLDDYINNYDTYMQMTTGKEN